jgi:hypothetical protein
MKKVTINHFQFVSMQGYIRILPDALKQISTDVNTQILMANAKRKWIIKGKENMVAIDAVKSGKHISSQACNNHFRKNVFPDIQSALSDDQLQQFCLYLHR